MASLLRGLRIHGLKVSIAFQLLVQCSLAYIAMCFKVDLSRIVDSAVEHFI